MIASSPSTPSGEDVRRTVLPGGLRVVTEVVPGVRSVALGIWVQVGSRDETAAQAGSSHFLEHLLFKGTARRDALEIAAVMDAVGGEMNAFTAKELTCYYARVLDEDVALAVDVICDLVTSSQIAAADVESERGVILEEIAMHDDDPSDVVHDAFAAALYGDTPHGRPVIGSVASIGRLSRTTIANYYRRTYTLPRLVVSAAGNLDHDRLVDLVQAAFGDRLTGDAQPEGLRPSAKKIKTYSRAVVQERRTEQANLVLGSTALARDDDRRFALQVLNAGLGGGMSSRLFQEVREKRGLAYSVYSTISAAADTGTFGVYAGCAPRRSREVLGLCREVLADVAAHGLTDDEVTRAKGQLRGGVVLDLEDTGARMSRIGKSELTNRELLPVTELLRRVAAVTPDDVRAVAADVLTRPLALGAIGAFNGTDLEGAFR